MNNLLGGRRAAHLVEYLCEYPEISSCAPPQRGEKASCDCGGSAMGVGAPYLEG